MYELYILYHYRYLFEKVEAFQAEFAPRSEDVIVLDYGHSQKACSGFVVLSFTHEIDTSLLARLNTDPDVLDYSIYVALPDADPIVYLHALAEL